MGQLVQGDKTGDRSLLDSIKNFIKIRDNKPGNVFLGLVHRIDRPTSGLVIYAKTSKALSRLTQMVKTVRLRNILGSCSQGNDSAFSKIGSLSQKMRKITKQLFSQNQLKRCKRSDSYL